MKRIGTIFAVLTLFLGLCACTAVQSEGLESAVSQTLTWQEQYELGVRYLSEGNYEEAILAFTAAIEIDPKRAPAYVGRGDAYVKSGETEENLAAAKADYETAIELDETIVEAYLGLADVYIRQEDSVKALEILKQGYNLTSDSTLKKEAEKIRVNLTNKYGVTEFVYRKNFVSYENFTTDQRNMIEALIEAVKQNDRTTFENMVSLNPYEVFDSELFNKHMNIFTQIGEYKVRVWPIPQGGVDIEIRPQIGMGYCAEMVIYHNDGDISWRYITCPCSDWQPNGEYQEYEEYQFSDGGTSTTEIRGTAAQGLCVGTETTIENFDGTVRTFTTEYDDSGRVGELWRFPLGGGGTEDPELLELIWW